MSKFFYRVAIVFQIYFYRIMSKTTRYLYKIGFCKPGIMFTYNEKYSELSETYNFALNVMPGWECSDVVIAMALNKDFENEDLCFNCRVPCGYDALKLAKKIR